MPIARGNVWVSPFFFQAEDGIRDQPRSRGLGDVYKRQIMQSLVTKLNAIHPLKKNQIVKP